MSERNRNAQFQPFEWNILRFDVLFGLVMLAAGSFVPDLSGVNTTLIGIIALIFYFADAWAFYFKTKYSRLRMLAERSGNDPENLDIQVPPFSVIIRLSVYLRTGLRFFILMMGLALLRGGWENPGWWLKAGLTVAVVFEIAMLSVLNFGFTVGKKDPDKQIQKEDRDWRRANFPRIHQRNTWWRELAANAILFISSVIIANGFWMLITHRLNEKIDDQCHAGVTAWVIAGATIFKLAFFCIVTLYPLRLVYWLGETYRAHGEHEKRRLRWSMFFAAICVALPVLVHLVQKIAG